jgi:hypothetical protein
MNIHDFARKPDVIQQKGHERRWVCSICFPLLQPPTSPHLLVLSIIAPPASRVADRSSRRVVGDLGAGVGVHLALAAGHDDVHEAAGVCETLLRAALGDLLLLLLLDLCAHAMSAIVVPQARFSCDGGGRRGWRGGVVGVPGGWRALCCAGGRVVSYLGSLRLDLTGTRERTVDLTHVGV